MSVRVYLSEYQILGREYLNEAYRCDLHAEHGARNVSRRCNFRPSLARTPTYFWSSEILQRAELNMEHQSDGRIVSQNMIQKNHGCTTASKMIFTVMGAGFSASCFLMNILLVWLNTELCNITNGLSSFHILFSFFLFL